MKFDELLSKLDTDILAQKQATIQLEEKRNKLLSLQDKLPNAIYHNGAICLPNIWDRVSCMKIERKQQYAIGQTDIVAKFSIGKKFRVDGRKLYSHPFENEIATIFWKVGVVNTNSYNKSKMFINDIDGLIDNECAKKKSFIHRIKLFIIDEVRRYGLTIDDTAYGNEISKLLLLR